jgi:dienelactone hydrolase
MSGRDTMKIAKWLCLGMLCVHLTWAADNNKLFRYDSSQRLNISENSSEIHETGVVHDISFDDVAGQRMNAYLVVPQGKGPFAAVLYVHWLGDPKTSNRTQFLKEAEGMAQHGAIALLVDMPWSVSGWFANRKLADDYEFSIRQLQNLRRSLDVLLQRPDVDRKRVAYVGHDFGATYGAMLIGVDARVRYAVLIAATPTLSDWFLLGAKIQGGERQAYIEKMAPLDPTNFIGKTKSVPVLLQFATIDKFIAKDKAELFANSASEPKEFRWYETGHEMNAQAATERAAWLEAQLKLTPPVSGN